MDKTCASARVFLDERQVLQQLLAVLVCPQLLDGALQVVHHALRRLPRQLDEGLEDVRPRAALSQIDDRAAVAGEPVSQRPLARGAGVRHGLLDHVARIAVLPVAQQVALQRGDDKLLLLGQAMLQGGLDDVVAEVMAAKRQRVGQNLIDQLLRPGVGGGVLEQAADDAAAVLVLRDLAAQAGQLLNDEAGHGGRQDLHHLLDHVVGVRRPAGLVDVPVELCHQVLAVALVHDLQHALHQPALLLVLERVRHHVAADGGNGGRARCAAGLELRGQLVAVVHSAARLPTGLQWHRRGLANLARPLLQHAQQLDAAPPSLLRLQVLRRRRLLGLDAAAAAPARARGGHLHLRLLGSGLGLLGALACSATVAAVAVVHEAVPRIPVPQSAGASVGAR
mmetsp:Transcript_77556/g.199688  ORF Transcript_77556/g.199688 Transcript_77556/m.199688 type:complete len:394 (+) Transcript_77556:525-1706(+)